MYLSKDMDYIQFMSICVMITCSLRHSPIFSSPNKSQIYLLGELKLGKIANIADDRGINDLSTGKKPTTSKPLVKIVSNLETIKTMLRPIFPCVEYVFWVR